LISGKNWQGALKKKGVKNSWFGVQLAIKTQMCCPNAVLQENFLSVDIQETKTVQAVKIQCYHFAD
jgi:hypothetical protein